MFYLQLFTRSKKVGKKIEGKKWLGKVKKLRVKNGWER
jgi:hypothetical protein